MIGRLLSAPKPDYPIGMKGHTTQHAAVTTKRLVTNRLSTLANSTVSGQLPIDHRLENVQRPAQEHRGTISPKA